MHELTFQELNKMRISGNGTVKEISPEKEVVFSKNGKPREGSFDFLLVVGNKTIGIEILTRPSKGKLKQKLFYADEVDEFIFVLPENSLNFYKILDGKPFNNWKKINYFGNEFSSDFLKVWLLNTEKGKFVEKGVFKTIFNVKK
ncbi:MAG: hypothetical protein V1672_03190 [Candidatus Diapherotrites archaeon]